MVPGSAHLAPPTWPTAANAAATTTAPPPPLVKTQFISSGSSAGVICSEQGEREKGTKEGEGGEVGGFLGGLGRGGGLSARQVAGDLALILSDMNNRFC